MNEIQLINYSEGLELLTSLALRRGLIPFFGAGFTAGCQACNAPVPNTNSAMESMKKLILNQPECELSSNDLQSCDFCSLSEIFYDYVQKEKRAQYFEENYTEVKLFQNQVKFITEIEWPYAYTINIDDGIERSSEFTPVLPYKKFRRPHTSKKLLFKLHGDALHESTYYDDENIVFSQSQYLQAITSENNKDIYSALLSDYSQQNILFIGCGLQFESDLQYVYNKCKPFQQKTYRIVIKEKEPKKIELQNLKKHGINTIVLVEEYEKFYSDFVDKFHERQNDQYDKIYEYINPTIIKQEDKNEALKLLFGGNIFCINKNLFYKNAFHIHRTIVNKVVEALNEFPCVLLRGRRFSGKTYALCSIAEKFKTKDIFYFPSTTFVDEEKVEYLFSNCRDGLFLFDSNSLTPDLYGLIIKLDYKFIQNGNKLVIALNSNDNFLPTKMNCTLIEIGNCFDNQELALSQKALNAYGLMSRKCNQTNIDFLYELKNKQRINVHLFNNNTACLTFLEKKVLLALCALDKLFYSDFISLNFSNIEIETLCKKLSPLIEIIPTGKDESTRHSSVKLVHNSKLALIRLLDDFSEDDISKSIIEIVKRFKHDYSRRRLYIEIILFDTLNQLFANQKNLKNLIANIYASLQPILKDDLHYWLQRAKSIYRTNPSLTELDEAYSYSQKAYADGENSLSPKAALTTALITCAKAELMELLEEKLSYYEEAVVLAHEAVFSEYFRLHPNYLKSEIPVGKNTHSERRIVEACEYVKEHSTNSTFILLSDEILSKFDFMKQNKIPF